ncbi:MAG: hypothetical protein JOS17DRAFT_612678 [Linnemannia elongata]|nr:MAG: hypothetical protein JOS17DRAFT_612678 [Linnemannia elongata]
MRTCEVYSTKVTHSGRHAGTSEAYRLNLSLDHIRHLGRWVLGQMESFYAPKNPIIGAFYMAHFNKPSEPYLIERDLVTPPLELQRLIFPWVERTFDLDDPGKTPSWIVECDQEMQGVDETVITDDDIHWESRFQHSTAQDTANGPDWTVNRLTSSAQVDRIAFLKLLVRMRRVILQDAVLYLTPDSKGRTLSNSLFTSLPHIFDSTVFTAFKSELLQAIALHRQNSTVLNPSVSMDKQDVSNAMNTISSQVSQGQIALEQRMDRMSRDIQDVRDVQKTMAAILPSTLEHTQYSPWHPYPRAPYPVQSGSCPSSHPCQSCLHPPSCPHPLYPHLSYTHPSYFHPAYLWPPYQQYIPYRGLHPSPHRQPISSQPTRQRRPQLVYMPPSHPTSLNLPDQASVQEPSSNTATPLPHPPHPQDSLSLASPPHPQDPPFFLASSYHTQDVQPFSMGYKMIPDRGALTIRAAWDEFHGPLSYLKTQGLFSNDLKTKKAYSRRREFVLLLQEAAERENRPVEVLVDEWTERFRGQTINSVREELKVQGTAK